MTDQLAGEMFFAAIIGLLLFLFFVPTTWIAYRNAKFWMPLRILFSFTVVPLFMALMTINYFFVADHFPWLVNLFDSIPGKSGKPASMLAFLITCPLAVLGCYVWYKSLEFVNSKISRNAAGQSDQQDSAAKGGDHCVPKS